MCVYPCALFLGACVHGHDESTDDHSSADATDLVSPTAPSPAAATAGSNATAGKTHTHIHTPKHTLCLDPVPGRHVWMCLF